MPRPVEGFTMARDLHQEVTDKIIAALEAGAGSWERPWTRGTAAGAPHNPTTGAVYRGVNVLSLWMAGSSAGYATSEWASYRQWAGKGAQVRGGETGTHIVYAGSSVGKDREAKPDGEVVDGKRFSFLKCSTVFNAAQVDGYVPVPRELPTLAERLAHVDEFIANTKADVRHGFDAAYYAPHLDFIAMPDRESFLPVREATATETYYGTYLHELVHWTKQPKRCDREFKVRFGDELYAAEELVAEIGAAFLCASLGISTQPRADHAAYVASWLRVLKGDKKAIFTAASAATKASEFLYGLQPASVEFDEEPMKEAA